MKYKLALRGAVFLLLGALMVGSSQAAVVYSLNLGATYREQAPTENSTSVGDTAADLWSVSVSDIADPGFYISSLTWTLPSALQQVFYDTAAGTPGYAGFHAFQTLSGPAYSNISVADGGSVLTLDFAPGVFTDGLTLDYSIDVDDGNVSVRGFHPSLGAIGGRNTSNNPASNPIFTAGGDLLRTQLDIVYWNGNNFATATTYFRGTGVLNDGTARADATLQFSAVPEPASLAMWTMLGAPMMYRACRRKARKS